MLSKRCCGEATEKGVTVPDHVVISLVTDHGVRWGLATVYRVLTVYSCTFY